MVFGKGAAAVVTLLAMAAAVSALAIAAQPHHRRISLVSRRLAKAPTDCEV